MAKLGATKLLWLKSFVVCSGRR